MRALAQIYDNYTQVVAKAGLGHQDDRGPQGQARLRRRAQLRHRGHRRPHPRGGRDRPEERHQAPGPRRRRVRAGDEGRLDRRLLLVGRPAHRRGHRPHHDARRSRCSTRPVYTGQAHAEVRRRLPRRDDPEGHLQGRRQGRPDDRGPELPRGRRRRWTSKLAFDLTKLLFDHKQDLVAVHPEAKNLDPSERQGGDRADRAAPRGEAILRRGRCVGRSTRARRSPGRCSPPDAASARSSSATTAAACSWRRALPESGRFALEYRHSYYRVPAREEFRAGGSGFRMVGVELAERGGARLLRDRGHQAARCAGCALAPERPAPLRAPAADRHGDRAAHARGRRPALPALRRRRRGT